MALIRSLKKILGFEEIKYYNRGIDCYNKGLYTEAIREFLKLVEKEQRSSSPFYSLGVFYSAEAHANLGLSYAHEGKYEEAVAQFREALKLNPNYPDLHFHLGVIYSEKALWDEAIEEFDKALNLNPKYADAIYYQGICCLVQGRHEEALVQLEKALRIDSRYANEFFQQGKKYLKEGKYDLAISEFKKARDFPREEEVKRYNLVVDYFNQGLALADRAIEELKNLIKKNPHYPDLHCDLGIIYRRIGKLTEAVREFKQAIKLNESYLTAHVCLGLTYMEQGKSREAIEELERVTVLDPQNALALRYLRRLKLFPQAGAKRSDKD